MANALLRRRYARVVFVLLLVVVLVGCAATFTPEQIAPAQLKPGDQVPVPVEPALVVSGAITNTNQEDALVLDLTTLERLRLVQYQVDDPWLQRSAVYSGVLMEDLLRFAGASESATTVHISAWDKYAVVISREDIERWSILLATRAEGASMAMDHGGPTRLILPYQHHPDVAYARTLSVWNIREIEVR